MTALTESPRALTRRGHGTRRLRLPMHDDSNSLPLCLCGCGSSVRRKGRLYLAGHNMRNAVRGGYKTVRYVEEDRGFATPCWIWQLGQSGKGYGCEWDRVRRRMVAAHILAFERSYGPVPSGLELDHLCRVRLCVNPDHLEPVTHAENIRRGKGGERNRLKTHCVRGHEFSGHNLVFEDGRRRCRKCLVIRQQEHRARKKAREAAEA